MAKRTSISPVGLSLIKAFEGFRSQATQLPNGMWVVGHGHTKTARKGARVSRMDAEDLLIWDLSQLEPKIRDVIFAPISEPQMDALLSLAFNISFESFRKSDVVRFLNQGDPISAAAAFDVWKKAKFNEHTIVVDALVRRRAAEKARFLKVDAGSLSLPTGRLQPLADRGLADEIDQQAGERSERQDMDAVIDLDQSAALSGLMGDQVNAEDGTTVTFGEGEPPQPEYYFSDMDPEPEPKPEVLVEEAEEKLTASMIPAVTAAMAEEGLVPVGEALKGKENPLKEVAENITGRLDQVAVPVSEADEPPISVGDDFVTEETPEIEPAVESETEPEAFLESQEAPPLVESDRDETVEAYTAQEFDTYQAEDDLPPLPETGDGEGEGLTPEIISREVLAEQDQEYDALSRRNLGMFVLMGILGVIFTAGGIFELRRAGQVVTYWDMIKGPGLAALGLLLILATVYYLVRRLGR